MSDNEEKLKLTDLVDIDILQKLQDGFANMIGVASITTDEDGPITKPSNFNDFCSLYMRGTKVGAQRCNQSNMESKLLIKKQGEPVIYTCHAGLIHFTIPIVIQGQIIASICGGQVSVKQIDEAYFLKLAEELNIQEKDKYLKALREIKVIPEEQIRNAIHLLSIVATTISNIGLKKLELSRQTEREIIYKNITETIRSSLDIKETKQRIVEIVCNNLKADRCFIMEYDKKNDKFLVVKDEYLSSENIPEYKGANVNLDMPNFMEAFKKGYYLVIDNKKFFINGKFESFDIEKETIDKLNVNSAYSIPFFYQDELLGVLGLHYLREYKTKDREIKLLIVIANQIAIAIHQSKLYDSERRISRRESVLRKTISIIRNTFEPEEVKKRFVEIIANYFKTDRCLFADYDKQTGQLLSFTVEKLKSEHIKKLIGLNLEEEFPEFCRKIKKGRNVIIKDLDKLLSKNKLKDYKSIIKLAQNDVKSEYGLSVKYKKKIMGILVLHFIDKKRVLTIEELDFLNALKDQVGAALYQSELYKQIQKDAQRESLIKNIFVQTISSFNIDQIEQIVKEVGIITKADRCYFVRVDLKNMAGKPIDYKGEYLASDDIQSIMGYGFLAEDVQKFIEMLSQEKDLVVFDYEKLNEEQSEEYSGMIHYGQLFGLKSGIGVPFFYQDKLLAVLAIEYIKKKVIPSDDELNFLRILGVQVGMAYNQIQNYQNVKKTAQREKFLRDIISKISSTLDILEIIHTVVFEIGKILNAQKVFFSRYEESSNLFLVPENEKFEYTDSPDAMRYMDMARVLDHDFPNFCEHIKSNKSIRIIPDVSKFLAEKNMENSIDYVNIKKYNFNSAIAFPVVSSEKLLGFYGIEYEHATTLEPEMVDFLSTLAKQTTIAMNQAELYQKEKESVKREKLLRSIIETIRNSLDINIIKNTIVTELGKALDADICFMMVYNPVEDNFVIDEYSEYRSSPNQKSYVGVDLKDKKFNYFINSLKNNQKIYAPNVEKYIIENNLQGSVEEGYLKEYNIKSGYNSAIYYANKLLGYIHFEYTNTYKDWGKTTLEFVDSIASQSGIAIHQAELYKITQIQAEREKLSRNIVEILRSTLDRDTIKHLFVQNIGKYFSADRVFFSDYDSRIKEYLPVTSNSEYLSSPDERSFVDFDFSNELVREFIQPLLGKREIKIFSWDEYVREKSETGALILRFKDANIKSSYSFPVLYQQDIMGYFCIEFTHEVRKLFDEDINRIRHMCAQAGIALHHADLYKEAQKSSQAHAEFVEKLSNELKNPLNTIVEISEKLFKTELGHDEEVKYLKHINNNAKKLLFLLDDVTNNSRKGICFNW